MAAVALQSMRTYRGASHRVFHRYVGGRLEFVDVDADHLGVCQRRALITIGSTRAARLALRQP